MSKKRVSSSVARRDPQTGADERPLCLYCNLRPGTTEDHVPPKSFFPAPRPNNLIKVPCCEVCRKTTTKDDEYFRFIVAMRWDVGASPSARACWPAFAPVAPAA